MPLYSYMCGQCSYEEDILQKFSDEPITECPQCKGKFTKQITLPNGRVRACLNAEQLGIYIPTDKEVAERKEAKEKSLPWWRNGTVEGLPKREKPLKLDKIPDLQNWIQTGEGGNQ